jgi:hypothetical protein
MGGSLPVLFHENCRFLEFLGINWNSRLFMSAFKSLEKLELTVL